jgi:glycosyltransferase involved in cell wall biosynthesis
LSIVEAMLSGVPVVASDVGSVRDAVVPASTGILVPPGEVEPLVHALRTLVEDRALAMRLADQARTVARARFTDTVMAERYDALWHSILR